MHGLKLIYFCITRSIALSFVKSKRTIINNNAHHNKDPTDYDSHTSYSIIIEIETYFDP